MSIKDLPKSLIESVIQTVKSRTADMESLESRLIAEGLRKFGAKKISQLSEVDYRAMYSWVQTKLAEAECHCNDIDIEESSVMKIPGFPNWTARIESEGDDGGNVSDVMYKGKVVGKVEFDYIADAFWIRVGTHQKAFNSWAEVIAHFKSVNNIRESKKLREDDMPNDEVYHKSGEKSEEKLSLGESSAEEVIKAELDKMGKTLGELSPEEKKNLFNKVDSLVKAKNESTSMTDAQKFSALRNVRHVEVRRSRVGKGRMDISLYYMGNKLASMDSPIVGSRRPDYWITPEGESLLNYWYKFEQISEKGMLDERIQGEESDKAKKDFDGDGEVESGSDEYLGARDKAIKKAMSENEDFEEVSEDDEIDLEESTTYQVFIDNKLVSSHGNEADAKNAVKNLNWSWKNRTKEPFARTKGEAKPKIEIRQKGASMNEETDLDWECSDCDSRGNRSSDKIQDKAHRQMRHKEYLGLKKLSFLSSEQKRRLEVLKKLRVSDNKKAMNESVAIESDELATNGAIGFTDPEVQMPIHADVVSDFDPITGKRHLRLLVQFPTSNMLTIVPPPSLPGAPTIEDLRMVVEGLPYFGEVIDRALRNAVDLPSNDPRFGGSGLSESKRKTK